jgi:GNAT superfamily N-acetyltransferase
MSWSLARARASDWDRAWALQRDAFVGVDWTPVEIDKCARAWSPPTTELLLVDGVLAGWIRLEHRPDRDWLDLLVVARARQRRGLGTSVLRALMADADRRGVPLWLSVHRDSDARRLYARLGFRELDRDERRVFMVHPSSSASSPP